MMGATRFRAAAAAVLVAAAPAAAQVSGNVQVPPATEKVAREAMTQLRSPVTPSHTLDMCPAEPAIALRDTIRLAALGGMSSRQIVEDVISRHGEQVRLVPRRRGFGLLAWLLTPLALLGGGVLIAFRLRAMRGQGPASAAYAGAPGLSGQEQAALDEALRDFDRVEDEP